MEQTLPQPQTHFTSYKCTGRYGFNYEGFGRDLVVISLQEQLRKGFLERRRRPCGTFVTVCLHEVWTYERGRARGDGNLAASMITEFFARWCPCREEFLAKNTKCDCAARETRDVRHRIFLETDAGAMLKLFESKAATLDPPLPRRDQDPRHTQRHSLGAAIRQVFLDDDDPYTSTTELKAVKIMKLRRDFAQRSPVSVVVGHRSGPDAFLVDDHCLLPPPRGGGKIATACAATTHKKRTSNNKKRRWWSPDDYDYESTSSTSPLSTSSEDDDSHHHHHHHHHHRDARRRLRREPPSLRPESFLQTLPQWTPPPPLASLRAPPAGTEELVEAWKLWRRLCRHYESAWGLLALSGRTDSTTQPSKKHTHCCPVCSADLAARQRALFPCGHVYCLDCAARLPHCACRPPIPV